MCTKRKNVIFCKNFALVRSIFSDILYKISSLLYFQTKLLKTECHQVEKTLHFVISVALLQGVLLIFCLKSNFTFCQNVAMVQGFFSLKFCQFSALVLFYTKNKWRLPIVRKDVDRERVVFFGGFVTLSAHFLYVY